MPRFEPFRAHRFSVDTPDGVGPLVSPPYDVFDEQERDRLAASHPHNIVRVDYPVERDGPGRYDDAGRLLRTWLREGSVVTDPDPSFSLYRMDFRDESGRNRHTVGVIGALEVVDEGAGGVLPHERTTPKARSDRLDLTRSTRANLSPVWGLSLASGLTSILTAPGEVTARHVDPEGVVHTLERVTDPARVASISDAVAGRPVLIADGHHRYAVSRTYRDECRSVGDAGPAELTMTYVQELEAEQLSIAAIHRLFTGITEGDVLERVTPFYRVTPAGPVTPAVVGDMDTLGALCLVGADGRGKWLVPRDEAFSAVRNLDSARLEHALGPLISAVTYQHGVENVLQSLATGTATCAVLIRPVSLTEIRRTADTGELMPPKSTFFTPKLLTGMVWRPLNP